VEQVEHEAVLAVELKVDPATQLMHERPSAERDLPAAQVAQAAVAHCCDLVEGSVQALPPSDAGVMTANEAV